MNRSVITQSEALRRSDHRLVDIHTSLAVCETMLLKAGARTPSCAPAWVTVFIRGCKPTTFAPRVRSATRVLSDVPFEFSLGALPRSCNVHIFQIECQITKS